jgi:rhodanese-related sulfurtransferase
VSIAWLVAGALALLAIGLWLWALRIDLEAIERIVRKRFPTVPQISTEALAKWLASGESHPLLLDARRPEEFQVAHLPGACRLNPDESAGPVELEAPKDTPIVTYCAVGYRSSKLAQQLLEAGFTNVQNLEGSIFRWANENRPLVCGAGTPTDKIHPYSSFWSRLVNKEHRGEIPQTRETKDQHG